MKLNIDPRNGYVIIDKHGKPNLQEAVRCYVYVLVEEENGLKANSATRTSDHDLFTSASITLQEKRSLGVMSTDSKTQDMAITAPLGRHSNWASELKPGNWTDELVPVFERMN
ncbi:hypothetical protein Peur_001680 [Populus x canadensis]